MEKNYKIGDIYSENGIEGVVFAVDQNGEHGRIVSLDEAELSWCRSHEWANKVETGCDNEQCGCSNMKAIRNIADWQDKYPAFAWCAAKGERWYLPAKEEIAVITMKERDAINAALEKKGAALIPNVGEAGRYWSSTEYDAASSWHVYLRYGLEYYTVKYLPYRVRAVAEF